MTQQNVEERVEERVRHCFEVSIASKIAVADGLTEIIAKAGLRLVNCLLNDGKLLLCGSGGSAANCLHFSSMMLNHYEAERPPLPVITLGTDMPAFTAIADEGHVDQNFARQIQALGQSGDILLVLATCGNSSSLLNAVSAANDRGIDTIVLSGRDGGVLANRLGPDDLELRVPGDTAALIREAHLSILHCFCDVIDQSLFGPLLG